jgi:tRNA-(ms[2]io[6]A)-hydroxylase
MADPAALLLDLAHNEKKAAGAVLAFLFRDPGTRAAGILSRLAREELTHFEWCLRELERRGLAFVPQIPTSYAGELARACRRGDGALLDTYLVASIIEARSGERLALLRDHCADEGIRALAGDLFPPEERHVEVLFGLAGECGDTEGRLAALLEVEAEIVRRNPMSGRVHG